LAGKNGLSDLGKKPDLQAIDKAMQDDPKTDLKVLSWGAGKRQKKTGFIYPFLLGRLVKQLEQEFDLVVIVAPSMAQPENALMYTVEAGLTLLVVETEAVKAVEIREAVQQLHRTQQAYIVTAMTGQ